MYKSAGATVCPCDALVGRLPTVPFVVIPRARSRHVALGRSHADAEGETTPPKQAYGSPRSLTRTDPLLQSNGEAPTCTT